MHGDGARAHAQRVERAARTTLRSPAPSGRCRVVVRIGALTARATPKCTHGCTHCCIPTRISPGPTPAGRDGMHRLHRQPWSRRQGAAPETACRPRILFSRRGAPHQRRAAAQACSPWSIRGRIPLVISGGHACASPGPPAATAGVAFFLSSASRLSRRARPQPSFAVKRLSVQRNVLTPAVPGRRGARWSCV